MKALLTFVLIGIAAVATAQQKPEINPKDTTVYTAVEQQPHFGEDDLAFNKYLAKNFRYPKEQLKTDLQARVIASFVVEKNGALSNILIMHPRQTKFEQRVIKLLKKCPKWHPAVHLGYFVRCRYSIPITVSFPSYE